MLRFKEAQGRYYEDSASDSSWSPNQERNLDGRDGSHIQPGRLKGAVVAKRILDVDNYFQFGVLADEVVTLSSQIDTIGISLKGSMAELNTYKLSLKRDTHDADSKAEVQAKIAAVTAAIGNMNASLAEKIAKRDELVKARAAEAEAKAKAEMENAAKLAADAAAQKATEDAIAQKLAQDAADAAKMAPDTAPVAPVVSPETETGLPAIDYGVKGANGIVIADLKVSGTSLEDAQSKLSDGETAFLL